MRHNVNDEEMELMRVEDSQLCDRVLEIGVAADAAPGESESGDRDVVIRTSRGALVAVVDGLGHGPEAAQAAAVAAKTLAAHSEEPLVPLVQFCHQQMEATRGAAMSAAILDAQQHTLSWISIGNVDGLLLRGSPGSQQRDETLVLRGGVLGLHLPKLQPDVLPIEHGDLLILATDGVRPGFSSEVHRKERAGRIAERICGNYRKSDDDALVLVARFVQDGS